MEKLSEMIVKAIEKYHVKFMKKKVLKTVEEVEANTDAADKYIAGAGVADELINKLMFPDGTEFYLDVKDGERGYNSDPARGADTFSPFKRKPQIVLIGSGNTTATKTFSATSIKGYNKLTSDNFFLRPSVHGQGGGSSRGSYGISYNPATGIVTVNEYVIGVTEWDRPFCAYLIYQLYAYV